MKKLAIASLILAAAALPGMAVSASATEVDYNTPISCQEELSRLGAELQTSLQYHNLGEATNYYNQAKAAQARGNEVACHQAAGMGELDMVRYRHGYRSSKFD